MRSGPRLGVLLAAAAIGAATAAPFFSSGVNDGPRATAPRRPRPYVQRMATASSTEIRNWNAAVEARKAAKRAAKGRA